MDKPAILIVDDDADVREAARLALGPVTDDIETAASPDEALGLMELGRFDCVLLDMNFIAGERVGAAGLDALAAIARADPAVSVVLMTSYGGVALAVESLKRGADDFLLKPWRNEALAASVSAAATRARESRKTQPLDEMERSAIEKALALHSGNIAQAALSLGLSRPALYRRMSKHGL